MTLFKDFYLENNYLQAEVLEKLLSINQFLSPASILDIGCGPGVSSYCANFFYDCPCHGIDINTARINKAKLAYAQLEKNKNLKFSSMDFLKTDSTFLKDYSLWLANLSFHWAGTANWLHWLKKNRPYLKNRHHLILSLPIFPTYESLHEEFEKLSVNYMKFPNKKELIKQLDKIGEISICETHLFEQFFKTGYELLKYFSDTKTGSSQQRGQKPIKLSKKQFHSICQLNNQRLSFNVLFLTVKF